MSDPERELRWLRRVRDLAHELGAEPDPERLPGRILDAAVELSGAERGFLVRLEAPRPGAGPRIKVEVARGFDRSDLRGSDGQVSRTVVERVIARREGLIAAGDDADLIEVSSVRQRRVKALMAAPMTLRGELVGALYLDHRHLDGPFQPQDLAPLGTFASQAALALETAALRAQAGAAGARLEAALGELHELRRERAARELAARPAPGPGTLQRFGALVGGSPAMAAVHAQVERAARSWEPVLILGESGTGKQLVAEEVHARSAWAEGPLVRFACAGATPREVESRLRLLTAPGSPRRRGSVLLDEVGELPLEAQAAVLRLLGAELRGERGATGCRLLATTRQDPGELVAGGALREDLYYRLDVLRIKLPPLRQRPEDVEPLLLHFASRAGASLELSPAARERLLAHRWPGNVRELMNEAARLVARGRPRVELADLAPEVQRGTAPTAPAGGARPLREVERAALERALAECQGNKTRAARLLGLPRSSFQDLLQRHGLA